MKIIQIKKARMEQLGGAISPNIQERLEKNRCSTRVFFS